MQTVLKNKWLTPKKLNSGKTVKLEVIISVFSMLEEVENPKSHYEQYHLNLRKCNVCESPLVRDPGIGVLYSELNSTKN